MPMHLTQERFKQHHTKQGQLRLFIITTREAILRETIVCVRNHGLLVEGPYNLLPGVAFYTVPESPNA